MWIPLITDIRICVITPNIKMTTRYTSHSGSLMYSQWRNQLSFQISRMMLYFYIWEKPHSHIKSFNPSICVEGRETGSIRNSRVIVALYRYLIQKIGNLPQFSRKEVILFKGNTNDTDCWLFYYQSKILLKINIADLIYIVIRTVFHSMSSKLNMLKLF